MGFFDRWSSNSDGSFTDTQDDSGDSDGGGDDSSSGGTRPGSSVPNNLSGGSSSDGSDMTGADPTENTDRDADPRTDDDGSSGDDAPIDGGDPGGSGGGLPDEPSVDNDNPFDSSDSGGSSGGSSDGGDSKMTGADPTENTNRRADPRTDAEGDPGAGGRPETRGTQPEAEQTSSNEEFDPEATQTGALEDTATDPEVKKQAKALESELAGQQITDNVDGLTATGAELTRDDIQVTQEGDKLVAGLSPVGQERIEFIGNRQAEESAERAIEDQLNTDQFTDEDVTVRDDGTVEISQDVREEVTEQSVAANNLGVRESDVSFDDGVANVEQDSNPRDQAAGDVESNTGLDQGEDFTLSRKAPASRVPTERGQGAFQIEVTEEGARELQAQQEQAEGDALTGAVQEFESFTGIDLPGETSEAASARQARAASDSGEVFGGEGDVESFLRREANAFDAGVTDPAADAAGDFIASTRGESNPLNRVATDEQREDFQSSGMNRAEAEGLVGGTLGILNPARIGLAGIEAGEAVNAGIEGTAVAGGSEEDFEQFESDLAEGAAATGADIATQAENNPGRLRGELVGGTIASTGLLKAGRAVGGQRGARAAGGLVQPGEEILSALRKSDRGGSSASGVSSGGASTSLDLGKVREATPNIETEIGPNAARGRFEVNINSNLQSPGGVLPDVRGRGRTAVDSTRQAFNDVRDLPSRARTAARNASFNADASLGAGRQRVFDSIETGQQSVENALGRVANTPRAARDRAAQSARNTAVSVEANITDFTDTVDTKVAQGRLAARRKKRDFELPTVPRGFVTDTDSVSGRVSTAIDEGRLEVKRFKRDAELPTVPRGFVTDSDGVGTRISNTIQEGRLEVKRFKRDAELPTVPRGFVTDSDSVFDLDISRPKIDLDNPLESVTDISRPSVSVDNPLEGVTDTSVRIDIGRPTSRTVDADDLEIEGQPGVEFKGDFDKGGSDVDFESGEQPEVFQVDTDRTGSGQLQLRRTETQADVSARAESDTQRKPDRDQRNGLLDLTRRAETTTVNVESAGMDTAGAVESGVRSEFEQGLDNFGAVDVGLESRVEPRTEPRTETGFEQETESFTETRSELRTETESELRLETRAETRIEIEPRTRTETDVSVRGVDPDVGRDMNNGDSFERTFEFDVASPDDVAEGLVSDVGDDLDESFDF